MPTLLPGEEIGKVARIFSPLFCECGRVLASPAALELRPLPPTHSSSLVNFRSSPAMLPLLVIGLLLQLTLAPPPATSELSLEEGYTVSTVLDFTKDKNPAVHPASILPRSRSRGIILLDSSASAFYSLPLPLSQDSEISLFSGQGGRGFADGDPTAAMFRQPKSFAIDSRDNVYVADRSNNAIRKISRDGW